MNYLLFVVATLVIVASCTNTPTDPMTPTLEGRWLWRESRGGFTGRDSIFAKVAEPRVFEFDRDGRFFERRSDTLFDTYNYEVLQRKLDIDLDSVEIVRFFRWVVWQDIYIIRSLTTDSLVLDDDGNDGYTSIYVRIE